MTDRAQRASFDRSWGRSLSTPAPKINSSYIAYRNTIILRRSGSTSPSPDFLATKVLSKAAQVCGIVYTSLRPTSSPLTIAQQSRKPKRSKAGNPNNLDNLVKKPGSKEDVKFFIRCLEA